MWEIYFWLITGFLIIIGLCLVYWVVQRRLKQRALSDNQDIEGGSFTLPGLRQMLKQGQISQEEFNRLKGIIINEVKAGFEKKDSDKGSTKRL